MNYKQFLVLAIALLNSGAALRAGNELIDAFDGKYAFVYPGKNITGLVGNGRLIVNVSPEEIDCKFGSESFKGATISINTGAGTIDMKNTAKIDSIFLPGCVVYRLRDSRDRKIYLIHSARPDSDTYLFGIKTEENIDGISAALNIKDFKNGKETVRQVSLTGSPGDFKKGMLFVSKEHPEAGSKDFDNKSFDDKFLSIINHYVDDNLFVECPDAEINRAVPFFKYHLQLGYDRPKMMVCDIFRWRDLWSRDFGSGFGPGALWAGMPEAVRATLDYEFSRMEKVNPYSYKLTDDASQGGSAEGMGFVSEIIWKYFLFTNDTAFLEKSYRVLGKWVKAWIDRDYDGDGLIVDVTEWMDHSRFFRLPEGIRTLYSNVLFQVMLKNFGRICLALGHQEESRYYDEYASRVKSAINEKLWNHERGHYDNYELWGVNDGRLAMAANALAVLHGISDEEKTNKILAAIEKNNWREKGSVTIFPAMTFVGMDNDQNVKAWPWWEAKEAKARFLDGDFEKGMKVLKWALDTMKYERYPGLIEEYLFDPDTGEIQDFAGHTYISAAGSTLDAITAGLFGVEFLEPGGSKIRITPSVPEAWDNITLKIPLNEGRLILQKENNNISIKGEGLRRDIVCSLINKDILIKSSGETVTAAWNPEIQNNVVRGFSLADPTELKSDPKGSHYKNGDFKNDDFAKGPKPGISIIRSAKKIENAGIFYEEDLINYQNKYMLTKLLVKNDIEVSSLDSEMLASGQLTDFDLIIFLTNVIPFRAKNSGADVGTAVRKYLEKGGRILLLSADTLFKDKMGENCSLFRWVVYTPVMNRIEITGDWKFRHSDKRKDIDGNMEQGYLGKYYAEDIDDSGWQAVRGRIFWENVLGREADGYGWYRKKIFIPAALKGREFFINLGMFDDIDQTYLNSEFLGTTDGWKIERIYKLSPGEKVYSKIKWDAENLFAVQCLDTGGGGGLHKGRQQIFFPDEIKNEWQYFNVKTETPSEDQTRSGVVYWGKGEYFGEYGMQLGLFGMRKNCRGVNFDPYFGLEENSIKDLMIENIYTDFAVRAPYEFIPLAYTDADEKEIFSAKKERFPCLALIQNRNTGSKIVVVPPEITRHESFGEILLKILGGM